MLYTAIILGLMSSLHCVGMCGPIAMMLPVDRTNEAKRISQILIYHIGRLLSYSFLGFLFGLVGRGFFLAGFQQQLSILVGIVMILFVMIPERKLLRYNFSKPIYQIISKIKSTLGKQFKNKSYKSLFTIGLLNGFLPCGMVYVALFGALAMPHILESMLYMFLFGLGTLPLMSLVVIVTKYFTPTSRAVLQKIIPVVTVVVGIIFIIRGLGLGIPYLSPETMNLFIQGEAQCH